MNRKHLLWILPLCTFGLVLSIMLMMPREVNAEAAPRTAESRQTESKAVHTYVLRDENGHLALYENGSAVKQYDVYTALLPEADRQLLLAGIPIQDQAQLNALLEDYGA